MQYRIREIREKKGLSQNELSRRAKVSRANIIRIEEDPDFFNTTVDTLEKIAKALEVPFIEVLCLDESDGGKE